MIGIAAGATSLDDSWELVRYLALDDGALAKLSNGLRNVPSTKSSLSSPELVPDERFGVFLDVFAHPRSASTPISVGQARQERLWSIANDWQAGTVANLAERLLEVDRLADTPAPRTSS